MIKGDGWKRHFIWEHSRHVTELYTNRCRLLEEEMTCAAQAADLLLPLVEPEDTLLDVGCGTGYFFHSLRKRGIPVEYYGIDACEQFISIGKKEMAGFGLDPSRLMLMRVEDLRARVDHVVCLNVLSNIDNYHRPLERLLKSARKSVILRESSKAGSSYQYVKDNFLDEGIDLKVHVNCYDTGELMEFMDSYGFEVEEIKDRRSQGKPEMVIDYPHYWKFFLARRRSGRSM